MRIASSLAALATVAVIAACEHQSTGDSAATSIVGVWRTVQMPATAPPCDGENSVHFAADGTFAARSDRQILRGTYKATPMGGGRFDVSISYTEHNGQPNCQGLRPEFVIEHTPPSFTT